VKGAKTAGPGSLEALTDMRLAAEVEAIAGATQAQGAARTTAEALLS